MDIYINDLIDRAARFWEQDEVLPLDLMVEMEAAGIIIIIIDEAHTARLKDN
jgi:hypothetical protein